MTASLGIDIGGTAARYVLLGPDGAEIARGQAGGATGHIFNPTERDRLVAAITAIVVETGPIAAACLGITGFGEAVRAEMIALLAPLLGTDRIALMDDMELAYRSAFAPGEGHLISAGTGSIGLHLPNEGHAVRVGGRGILIDDAGSGTWIALQALDRLWRQVDETGDTSSILARELSMEIGGEGWDATRAFVYGSDRGRIGTLARAVARAAEQGDPIARDILERAGQELARLGMALAARCGDKPVGFVGGIVALHPLVRAGIEQRLAGHDIRYPMIDAAVTAAKRAATRIGLP